MKKDLIFLDKLIKHFIYFGVTDPEFEEFFFFTKNQ